MPLNDTVAAELTGETIFVFSDIHLNILPKSKREGLLRFFSSVVKRRANRLYLNGDIIDFFAPNFSNEVTADLRRFIDLLYEISGSGVTVHYNIGNHDLPLLLYFRQKHSEHGALDVFHEYGPVQLSSNLFLNYRSIRFTYAKKQVHLEHGHIYDPGWTHSDNWRELFNRAATAPLDGSFVENVLNIKELFKELKDDSAYRLIKTGSEMPVALYASNEARRLTKDRKADWVILGHFHIPAIEEIEGGFTYANSGDSWQHSNYLVLTGEEIRLGDWHETVGS
ncbi:hypothetical protein ES708_25066 [subsurface metagenome]